MTPQRWAQIEDLFHRAAECGPKERTALLDEACSSDPELRREVAGLLSCEASAGDHVQEAVRDSLDSFAFPRAGETVSHYRILDGLGGGGMGLVYRAEDLKLGRRVALKFLPEESAKDPAALGRFEREARSASALEHPNICPIYEFGEHAGQPFLVMQLLEGQTLRGLISATAPGKAPLELNKLLDLAIQITDGLEAAHRRDIIHRDIKPANIFVTGQGQAKILDFGLAKLAGPVTAAGGDSESDPRDHGGAHRTPLETAPLAAPDPFLSRTGAAMGTAGYMSPEQVRGEGLDARTDLFSFGLVLYEMATGQRAFLGGTGPVLQEAILKLTPSPARRLNPKLPVKLEKIINQALEKNREARYQTASELNADLEALRREMGTRTRLHWGIPASTLVFALLIASAAFWFAKRQPSSTQAAPQIKFRRLTTNSSESRVNTGSISPDGKFLAYSDPQGIHVKEIETGATHTVLPPETLKNESVDWQIMSAGWFPDSTRFIANAHSAKVAWSSRDIWMFSRLGGVPHKLRDHAIGYSVSPDGSLISFGTNTGRFGEREIWLMGPDGEQARKLFDTDENSSFAFMLWSRDGQHALVRRTDASGDAILSRDLHGGPPVQVFTPAEVKQMRGDLSWLPDGRLIYQVADPGSGYMQETCNFWAMRLDVRTGESIEKPKRLTNWTGFCVDGSANATADGKRIAFLRSSDSSSVRGVREQATVYVADLQAHGSRIRNSRPFTLDESANFANDWTSDSSAIIFTSNRAGLFGIYRQALNEETPHAIPTTVGLRSIRVSSDGKWIFGILAPKPGSSSDPDQIMRIPAAGGSPELIFTAQAHPWSAVYCASPPSSLCVVGERTEDRKHAIFTSFDPVRGRGSELVRFDVDPNVDFFHFHVSPEGTRLAVTRSVEGPIHVLSLRGQPEKIIPAKPFHKMQQFVWAADGRGLYVADQIEGETILSYLDLQGNAHVLWENRGGDWIYGKPSPDGRHLAIGVSTASRNMWMMENF